MKVTQITAPPVPQPPPTYTLSELTQADAELLREVCYHGSLVCSALGIPGASPTSAMLNRLYRALITGVK